MKVSVSFHGISDESRARLHALIEERAHRLERHHLSSFQPDLVRIEGRVEKNATHHLYRVALRLKLPRCVLAAAAKNYGLQSTLKEAFDDLDRRTERHVSRLRRAHLWKRPARRARLEELTQGAPGVRDREQRRLLCELIEPYLDATYGYAHREILYLERIGDARAGALEPSDVVAGALLRALERLNDPPHRIDVREWLLTLIHEEITEALRQELLGQSLESPPTSGAEEPTAGDEERYEYFEPEEYLKLEDLLPDTSAQTPEEAAIERDTRRTLVRALTALPRTWRRAVMLTTFEGLPSAQAGIILGHSEAELNEILQHAHAFLEACTNEAGFEYEPKDTELAAVADLGRIPLPSEDRNDIVRALSG